MGSDSYNFKIAIELLLLVVIVPLDFLGAGTLSLIAGYEAAIIFFIAVLIVSVSIVTVGIRKMLREQRLQRLNKV